MNEAKQKAQELVKKFETAIVEELEGGDRVFKYTAKQCALICCDEMIKIIPEKAYGTKVGYYSNPLYEFWQSVKTEIQK